MAWRFGRYGARDDGRGMRRKVQKDEEETPMRQVEWNVYTSSTQSD